MGLYQCGIIWLINLPILITYLLDIVLDIIGRSYTSITNLRVKGIRHSKVIGKAIQHLTTHKLFSRVLIMSSTIYVLIITFPIYLTQKFKDNILRVTLYTDRPKIISQDFSSWELKGKRFMHLFHFSLHKHLTRGLLTSGPIRIQEKNSKFNLIKSKEINIKTMPKCCRKSFHLNDNAVRCCLQTHSINQKEKFPTLIAVNFSKKNVRVRYAIN